MEASVVENWLPVDDLRIHCLTAGDAGSPVLLLHGGGIDSAYLSYRFNIGPIAQRHRVFAPDWPGYGESDKPDVQYGTDYYIGFLGRLMDSLGLERAALVGLSLGGGVALGFALEAPHRVGSLVLVDSYGLGGDVPGGFLSYLYVRLPLVSEFAWAAVSHSRWTLRKSLEGIVHDPGIITEEVVDEMARLVAKPGAGEAWASFQRSEITTNGLRTDYVDRLPGLSARTLILHGAHDRLVPVEWARRAHGLIPDCELRIVPDVGHWLPREKPEAFNPAVLEFLAESEIQE